MGTDLGGRASHPHGRPAIWRLPSAVSRSAVCRLVGSAVCRLPSAVFFLPRLYRRRIGARLVAAHVLVVLVTITAIQAAGIAALFGWLPASLVGGEEALTDYTLGEKARAVSDRFETNVVADRIEGGPTLLERGVLEGILRNLTDGEVAAGTSGDPSDPDQLAALNRVAHALLTDADGVVIATSDPDWAAVGRPVEAVGFGPVADVTRRAIALEGRPAYYGESYAIGMRDRVTVASHVVRGDGGRIIGAVTLQGDPYDPAARSGAAALVETLLEDHLELLLFATVTALLVAAPVGAWHARGLSRRLARVANAADGMARGDLGRRVEVRGEDEVARVGERFNDMVERLAATDRARRAFVANVSHELRTPVATIRGYAELYRVGALEQPPALDDAMRRTEQEAIRMGTLVDDLLHLARLDQGRPLERKPVDLVPLTVDAVRDAQAVDPDRAVRALTDEAVVVSGDPARLHQVIANLVANALVHAPGATVDVQVRAEGETAVIEVSDDGPGMEHEDAARAFERFYRADASRSRHHGGSGLGLSIVDATVQALGGRATLTTAPGSGTTVRVELPLAEPAVSPSPGP